MSVLWALVALLSIHIGGLNDVSGQILSSIKNSLLSPTSDVLPVQPSSLLSLPVGLPRLPVPAGPAPGIPPQPKKIPQKDPAETYGQHCEASAWYFISKKKVDDYLNDTIPEAIKNLVNCAEYGLTGLLKTVLKTVDLKTCLKLVTSLGLGGESNLLSGLPLVNGLTGSLPVVGGLSGDSLPVPLPGIGGSSGLNSAIDLLGNVNKQTSVLGGVLGQSGNPLEGKNAGDLLKSTLKSVKDSEEIQDKSEDLIKKASSLGPNEIPDANLDTLQGNPAKIGHLLENLDLKLHPTDIVIKTMTTITEGSSINVKAYVEADIKGTNDLLGSVTDLLSFQMGIAVQLKIDLANNNTKCRVFEVQEKDMKVEEIHIKIIDRLKKELLEVLPLPLDSVIPTLLMLNAASPEGECDLGLKNPECKNEAIVSAKGDLFTYHLKKGNFTSKGLQISYCAEINYKDKSSPVPGGPAPPISEDVEASLALSSSIVKSLVTSVAKESFVKSKDGELKVKTMSYKLVNKKAQLNIHSDLKENAIKTAGIDLMLDLSHNCVIINGYLSGGVTLISSENRIDPPDNEAAKEMGKQLITKVVSNTNENLRRMNVPLGPQIEVLNNALVQVDSQGDLIASKQNNQ